MKRIYQSFTGKKSRKEVIKQADRLRKRLASEHGEVFEALKLHAQRLHSAPPLSSDIPPTQHNSSEEKVDTGKNLKTVLKFIEERGTNGKNDLFAKKIFELLREKTGQ